MSKMKESARKEAIEVLEASIISAAKYYEGFGDYFITEPDIEDGKMTFTVIEPSANMEYTITADLKSGNYQNSKDLYDTDYPKEIRQALQYFHDEYNEFSTPENFEEVDRNYD